MALNEAAMAAICAQTETQIGLALPLVSFSNPNKALEVNFIESFTY